jgi:UPF0716 protein FxsA
MILLVLFASLIGVTLLEFYVVIQVGQAIGVLPTLAIMVVDAMIGSALMRSQGRAVWRRLREAIAAGRPPTREVLDGALVVAGGAFLITPGFVTDIFGALLLIPPTRAIVRRMIVRHFSGRVLGRFAARGDLGAPGRGRTAGWQGSPRVPGYGPPRDSPFGPAGASDPAARPSGPHGQEYDVEGTAVEVEREEPGP